MTLIRFLLLVLVVCLPCWAAPLKFDFESDEVGKLPRGWTAYSGQWFVTESAPGKVMAQTGASNGFNLVVDPGRHKDLKLSVRVRAMAGHEDRGGGLVWRCHDSQNYYICRINPLENNFRIYKVVKGQRLQMGSADVKLASNHWYTLQATMRGAHIECWLDGKRLLTTDDSTFAEAGKVGLWSKADAQSHFDDLQVEDE